MVLFQQLTLSLNEIMIIIPPKNNSDRVRDFAHMPQLLLLGDD